MSAETAPVAAPPVAVSEEAIETVAAEAATEVEAAVALSDAPVVTETQAEQALTPTLPQREREVAAERIRSSALLPPAIRDCLARVVQHSGEASPGGPTRVPVDELVRAVEEAVPDFLRVDRVRATSLAHPAGDAFFSGDPSALSDQQAEEIARGQLARSGLLRGQRVRVAD
jgi:hypothetical protein